MRTNSSELFIKLVIIILSLAMMITKMHSYNMQVSITKMLSAQKKQLINSQNDRTVSKWVKGAPSGNKGSDGGADGLADKQLTLQLFEEDRCTLCIKNRLHSTKVAS